MNLTRQTVAAKFKHLSELNLISEKPDENGRYYLEILPADVAGLIPEPTLKLIVDTLSEHCISAYLYLLMRYVMNNEKPFNFSLIEIKKHIGICATTRSNDEVINNILFVL